jgi:hypothetical protein
MPTVDSNANQIILVTTSHSVDDVALITQLWGEDVKKAAGCHHISLVDLHVSSPDLNQKVRAYLSDRSGREDLLAFYGHGSESELLLPGPAGKNPEELVGIDSVRVLRRKQVCATSCESAARLGPLAVEEGATCYAGYSSCFHVYYDGGHDDFRECANAWIEPVLAKGATWETAIARMRATYEEKITFCLSDEGIARYGEYALLVRGYLKQNLDSLRFYGSENATFATDLN